MSFKYLYSKRNKRAIMFIQLLICLSWLTSASATLEAKPGCQSTCGNVKIPYPFGVGSNCSIHPSYSIDCDKSYNPHMPFISTTNLRVRVVNISETEVRIANKVAGSCHGDLTLKNLTQTNMSGTPYTLSGMRNKFYGTGCNTLALIRWSMENYIAGCVSYCSNGTVQEVPVVLDWAIGENRTFACKYYDTCYNANDTSGYRCNCPSGYMGNPYLTNGCQDECKNNPCIGSCKNTPGDYKCSCPMSYHGDGRHDGTGCNQRFPTMKVVLGKIHS
ncbi:hypothetical protein GIB67_024745 [Kingdonia uniflora]|uniref:EGF-like domain-containing protein n=1 Tax=Kingdonia uniflora TaxID=39325 RepID=A0A7J7NA54_9MAGN|nr:hypothetical protein GIB67_024745 [Kingdonia uniflora]